MRCGNSGVAAWLREALLPCFTEIDPLEGDVLVDVSASQGGRHDDAVEAQSIPCFALEQRVSELPARRVGRTTAIVDEYFGVGYDVGPDVVTVRPLRSTARLRVATFRVVRELAVAQAHSAISIDLHAAGVAHRGQVALLIGPKRAGKTTTLIQLASCGGAAMVTNDRALVARTPTGWDVRGVPTLVNVRRSTQTRVPHLFQQLPAIDHLLDLTVAEVAALGVDGAKRTEPGDLALSPAQLAGALGAARVGGGPLGCIAIVSVDELVEGFHLRRLEPKDAAAQIGENRFGASTEPRSATAFEIALGADPPASEPGLLAAVAEEVPSYELRVGPRLLDEAQMAASLLNALAGDV